MAAKLEKAHASLDMFTGNKRMLGVERKAIIASVLPRYKVAEKVSAYQTNPKIQAKFKELKKEKETTGTSEVTSKFLISGRKDREW